MNKNKLKFIAAILTIGAAWFVIFAVVQSKKLIVIISRK